LGPLFFVRYGGDDIGHSRGASNGTIPAQRDCEPHPELVFIGKRNLLFFISKKGKKTIVTQFPVIYKRKRASSFWNFNDWTKKHEDQKQVPGQNHKNHVDIIASHPKSEPTQKKTCASEKSMVDYW